MRISRYLLMAVALICFATGAHASSENDFLVLQPIMHEEIERFWPDSPRREFVPSVTEQESRNKPHAELKTAREFGCGIGQFTKAFNADGSVRFDALEETKRLDPSLAGWSWRDCYNITYQVRGVVLKLRANHRACSSFMLNDDESLACAAAQYNGGAGSTNKRVRICRMVVGCKPNIWFGNLEKQCPQSKVKVAGYGEDFCTINSKYPGRVFARMPKYEGKL